MENKLKMYTVTTDFPAIYELVYVKQSSYRAIGKPQSAHVGSRVHRKVNWYSSRYRTVHYNTMKTMSYARPQNDIHFTENLVEF